MLLGLNNCTGPRVQKRMRAFVVPRGGKLRKDARRPVRRIIELPGGKWGLAEVTWLGGREDRMLPGEYATEMEAERAARDWRKDGDQNEEETERED